MPFSYKPLWKLLIDKEMNKKRLMELTGISKSTVDKMYRGENVSLEVIDRICRQLDCDISDVVSYRRD
ncbi:MAG: helix-turn-helix transcriptional regulator [Lachnospiraceae bacterium]|nr:helix-turn-helix transcriptional regulator [Lachnospiraceae bacterium]